MQKQYKFQGVPVEIETILCDDGDVILQIGNFPARFTVYLNSAGAQDLIRQLQETTSREVAA